LKYKGLGNTIYIEDGNRLLMEIIQEVRKLRWRSKIILAILAIIIVALIGFVVWAETPPGPMPEVNEALQSDSTVSVTTDKWLVFSPVKSSNRTGLIIYPGGRVNYKSYAPAAHALAAKGYLTIIVPMPLNLAVLGINKANSVIESYPDIKSWAVGGHSLGGTMAAQFAYNNPSLTKGLVLWAAYPATGNNFSNTNLAVVTIHGTNDGLVSSSQIDGSMKILPNGTLRVEINGGNHAQFGWYGNQPGDKEATISRELQQEQVVNATIQLLQKIKVE
jgi:hypothetical protein